MTFNILNFLYIFLLLTCIYIALYYIHTPYPSTKKITKKYKKSKPIKQFYNNKNLMYTIPKQSCQKDQSMNLNNEIDKNIIIEDSDLDYYRKLEQERQEQIHQLLQQSQQYIQDQDTKYNNELPFQQYIIPQQLVHHNINNYVLDDVDLLQQLNTDNQNVHDSSVQHTIKNAFLNKNITVCTKENIIPLINEITAFAQHHQKNHIEIRNIMLSIAQRNATIHNLQNHTEMTILLTIWTQSSDNVKLQLLNELLDMKIDQDHIVCPTGVVSRIINSEIVEHPEDSPKTIEIIRQEMLQTAAQMRSELEKENKNITNKAFKQLLFNKFKDDYKDHQEIIPMETIQKELDKWDLDNEETLFETF